MCGIAGLFLKDKSLEPQLGAMLSDMLVTLSDRGPDSAGIAIYGNSGSGSSKITVQSAKPARDFAEISSALERVGIRSDVLVKDTHAVVTVPRDAVILPGFHKSVHFDDVGFAYVEEDGSPRPVLRISCVSPRSISTSVPGCSSYFRPFTIASPEPSVTNSH